MLKRMKWNPEEEDVVSEDEDEPEKQILDKTEVGDKKVDVVKKVNRCDLIWEVKVLQAVFNDFQMKALRSELQARKFLTDRGCVHYWDMAKNFTPPTK